MATFWISVHSHTTVYPADTEGIHKLACYPMRAPVNLSRLRFHSHSGLIAYEPKAGPDVELAELTDPLELVARVLIHIPEPNKHLALFYGAYANRRSGKCRDATGSADTEPTDDSTPDRRRLRKRWAEMLHRIYALDPLTCARCGAPMKILAFITEHAVIKKILEHRDQHPQRPRAPPTSGHAPVD